METVMGGHGLGAILNLAGLRSWINNLPTDDADRGVDFAEFSAIHGSLEEMYGPRAGRGLARRAAWTSFPKALRGYGAIVGVTGLSFKILPLPKKLARGLPAMARVMSAVGDQQATVTEEKDCYVFSVERCPVCWGRHTDAPACSAITGFLEEGLLWASAGKSFRVEETECAALGGKRCAFCIDRKPMV
jgi:predicted hydrocarbon binding protein